MQLGSVANIKMSTVARVMRRLIILVWSIFNVSSVLRSSVLWPPPPILLRSDRRGGRLAPRAGFAAAIQPGFGPDDTGHYPQVPWACPAPPGSSTDAPGASPDPSEPSPDGSGACTAGPEGATGGLGASTGDSGVSTPGAGLTSPARIDPRLVLLGERVGYTVNSSEHSWREAW